MVNELVKQLLEAGVHFGHQTKRWNPKMKQFIFGQRAGIYIIDLEKTADRLLAAKDFIKDISSKGGNILFIGTKKQAQDIVEESAKKTNMYYVKNRWSGGLLTNFQTVKKSLARLNEIEQMKDNGVWENLKKKEIARLNKEKEKLLFNFGGVREMKSMPEAVFMVDPKREDIAVCEANKLGIPIIAIVDTNCDPEHINFPVPGNDDALKSIRLITSLITDSVVEGREEYQATEKIKKAEEAKAEEVKKKVAEEAKAKAEAEKKLKDSKKEAKEEAKPAS
jgi:small subunit ribosomal protein S2